MKLVRHVPQGTGQANQMGMMNIAKAPITSSFCEIYEVLVCVFSLAGEVER